MLGLEASGMGSSVEQVHSTLVGDNKLTRHQLIFTGHDASSCMDQLYLRYREQKRIQMCTRCIFLLILCYTGAWSPQMLGLVQS